MNNIESLAVMAVISVVIGEVLFHLSYLKSRKIRKGFVRGGTTNGTGQEFTAHSAGAGSDVHDVAPLRSTEDGVSPMAGRTKQSLRGDRQPA